MIIGFFDINVALLPLLKDMAQKFPSHDFVLYADTLNGPYTDTNAQKTATYVAQGLNYLISRHSCIIVPGHTMPIELIQKDVERMDPLCLVVAPESLRAYLDHMQQEAHSKATDIAEETPPHSPQRIIHLTKHTRETDAEIERLLEGRFIERQ